MNTSPQTSGRSQPTAPRPYMWSLPNPFRQARSVIADFLRGLADVVVTVLVGPEETAFRIHKGLLCSKSEYFRAAFEGSFRESTEKKIQLRDEDSKIFQFYAALIYTDKAALSWNEEEFDVDVCCRLYVLADRLGSENIQNIVMDVIHGRCSRLDLPIFGLGTINHVFNNTLPGSRLRAILIDVASYDMDLDNQPELVNADPEFLFEV
ncbi:MAG: hypothetical protein LQ337_008031 [Flavoplaca oasis]|nr:MAG: hypothetical protein LQ337_008031 [Flavoplaca oasis]